MTEHARRQDIEPLLVAIAHLEAQRATLGDAVVDAALIPLRQQLAELEQAGREPPTPALAGERKLVTVLFADIAGFTALAETLDPEAVRDLMNACFDHLVPIVEKYEGTVDKFIGDEIMALFGAPVAHENDPERALRAALEIRDALAAFNAAHDTHLGVHLGVNTGLVIAGGIGSGGRQQYSVMGDAVNVAFRLREAAQPGEVLVGPDTHRPAAPLFDFEALGPIQVKGKAEPVTAHRVLGLKARPEPVRGLAPLGLRAPLVGRADELARLQAVTDRLQAGRGGIVSIVGEAGVGKSRLVAELRQQVAGQGDAPQWYEGRCLSYGEMLSYHPFLALLRRLIGVSPEADLPSLETRLREFLVDLLPHRVPETYPYLADLLGLPLGTAAQERINGLASESRQWQVFQVFESVLAHLAQRAPTVVVLEDLHWVDPTSLALLEHLAPLGNRVPILFLLVLRPHYGVFCQQLVTRLQTGTAGPYEEIDLAPLSPTHSRELVEYLLVIEALSAPVRDLILSRAEGNPLFLEEVLRALIGQGVLQRENDHWRVASGVELDQIVIPPTLQGVITARLDRLEAETKAVLQMAAVIGRIFWYRVLDYIASVDRQLEHMLGQHLAELEQVELIRQTRQHPDLEYIFKHVLVQEAAYRTLLRERRRLFHRRVADALETIFADNPEEQYGLLAHHYEAAGDVDQAIRYLRRAGDQARRAYALAEADEYYRRALALLPAGEVETRQQLLFSRGLINLTRGDFGQAGEYYAAAFRLQQERPARRPDADGAHVRRPLRISWGDRDIYSVEPGVPVDEDSALVNFQLFAGLVRFDAEMSLVPDLAERWEVDAAGCRYRFHLRRDARWSDGTPLTAHDFVYAWRRWADPATGAGLTTQLYVLQGAADYHQGRTDDPTTIGVRARDDHTLEVDLAAPVAYLLPLLTAPIFFPLPRHCWPPARPPWEDPSGLVGNGPFRLVEWRRGGAPQAGRIVLERNPRYHGVSQGNVDRAEILHLSDADRVARFLTDELDVCWVPYNQEDQVVGRVPAERWMRRPLLNVFYCGLVANAPPLDDRRVRRALAMAVDRAKLAEFVAPGAGTHARGGVIPPGMPGHTPELALLYDPEPTRAWLEKAAPGLSPLRLAISGGVDNPLIQGLLFQWQQLGIEFVLEPCVMSELFSNLHGRNPPHLFTAGWIADYPDPHNFLVDGFIHWPNWRDPAYGALAEEASQTLDVRRRMALYHEMDRRLVVEDVLYIPLSYGNESVVVQPRVRHYPRIPLVQFFLQDVVLAPSPD